MVKTEYTDLELNMALAQAIGYAFLDCCYHGPIDLELRDKCVIQVKHNGAWRTFDYRDWNVIGPIAAKYNCFPIKDWMYGWSVDIGNMIIRASDNPQKAIALAVIEEAKKGK